jgi:hypothetical protein
VRQSTRLRRFPSMWVSPATFAGGSLCISSDHSSSGVCGSWLSTRTPHVGREAVWAGFLDLDLLDCQVHRPTSLKAVNSY